jgi:hypothetical protein
MSKKSSSPTAIAAEIISPKGGASATIPSPEVVTSAASAQSSAPAKREFLQVCQATDTVLVHGFAIGAGGQFTCAAADLEGYLATGKIKHIGIQ